MMVADGLRSIMARTRWFRLRHIGSFHTGDSGDLGAPAQEEIPTFTGCKLADGHNATPAIFAIFLAR